MKLPIDSYLKILLLTYIIPFGQGTNSLLPHGLRTLYNDHSWFRQSSCFFTILVLTSVFTKRDFSTIIYDSFIIYALFLLSTRANTKGIIVNFLITLGLYLYFRRLKVKEEALEQNININSSNLSNIKKKYENSRLIGFISLVVVFILITLYSAKTKHIQYGGNFDPAKFLLK